jgi:hypothetical protein
MVVLVLASWIHAAPATQSLSELQVPPMGVDPAAAQAHQLMLVSKVQLLPDGQPQSGDGSHRLLCVGSVQHAES